MNELADDVFDDRVKPSSRDGSIWEIVRFALIALIVVIPLRIFIAEPFIVSGSSMVPAFENGNYLIIDKLSYKLTEPERHDVVVFRYPRNPDKFFIKRIVGLPNETIDIKGINVTITNTENKDGTVLSEPYVKSANANNTHLELGSDEYFVMGDNRAASSDSRYWGAVERELLVGKPLLRLLPLRHIDVLPGHYQPNLK